MEIKMSEQQKERNEQIRERHSLAVDRLRSLVTEETVPEWYRAYFQDTGIFLLELENVSRKLQEGIWESISLEEMESLNEILYSDILGENYKTSFANPAYASEVFGEQMGRLLS